MGPTDDRLTLLRSPSLSPADVTECTALSTRHVDDPAVLHVDYVRRPSDRVRQWQRYDESVADLAIVRVDAGSSFRPQHYEPPEPVVAVVDDPANLTGVGLRVVDCLERWDDHTPAVCLHSLSTMLQYVDPGTVGSFLAALRQQLVRHDAVGHVHVDPAAHEEPTLDSLAPAFDSVVDVTTEQSSSARSHEATADSVTADEPR